MNQIMKEKSSNQQLAQANMIKSYTSRYISLHPKEEQARKQTNRHTKKTTNKSKQRFTRDLHLYKLLKNEIIR